VSFLAGWRLVLLLLVALLLLAYVIVQRQRRKYVVRFTNVDLLASVAPKRPGWRRHVAAAFLLLALGLSVVAFARPTWPTKVPRERATVMLAFDVSQSMAADDVKPTRLQAAQQAAVRFADILPPKFKLGLVTFAGNAGVVVPPTTNRARVKAAVRNVELQQRTAIGEAIFASLDAIETIRVNGKESKVPATIVVMSDGFTNAGRPNAQAAQAAVKAKVPVSTISFGTQEGTVVVQGREVGVPASPEALEAIADSTGGRFSAATTGQELQDAYEGLNSSIGYREVPRDVTEWFVGIALAFAFLAGAASLLWTSRLP
jgi:Ca-activated chloride channel family protein